MTGWERNLVVLQHSGHGQCHLNQRQFLPNAVVPSQPEGIVGVAGNLVHPFWRESFRVESQRIGKPPFAAVCDPGNKVDPAALGNVIADQFGVFCGFTQHEHPGGWIESYRLADDLPHEGEPLEILVVCWREDQRAIDFLG